MKPEDLKALRNPLIVLVAVLVAGAAAIYYTDRQVVAARQLERAGFIGEEQRINWLDSLRIANQQTDLFGIDYQIETQKSYPRAAELNPGAIRLNQSVMKLRFSLLHEEDLTRFVNALARQGGGIFTVDRCTMRRLNTGGVIRYQPNVSAECELAWITAWVEAKPEQKKP